MKIHSLALLSIVLLSACSSPEVKPNPVVEDSAVVEEPEVVEDETAVLPEEIEDEEPCMDESGEPYFMKDRLAFWNYARLEPEGAVYRSPLLHIQFQYEGPDGIYYPTSPAEDDREMENFLKFDSPTEARCVDDGFDNVESKIHLHTDGVTEWGETVEDWMNIISEDRGRPGETVRFGQNTYTRIQSRNMGDGLVDYYFIEHNGDYYEFSFAWVAPGAFGHDAWWNFSSLPLEYQKVLETVEFL